MLAFCEMAPWETEVRNISPKRRVAHTVDGRNLAPVDMSHEKNSGWLGYIGDYTIKLYGDDNKPL